MTAPDSAKWTVLMEAVRLDFVQKGPDTMMSSTWGDGAKRQANENDTLRVIDNRYRMIFGTYATPIQENPLQSVSSLMKYSKAK